jgi:hypothetical protein
MRSISVSVPTASLEEAVLDDHDRRGHGVELALRSEQTTRSDESLVEQASTLLIS